MYFTFCQIICCSRLHNTAMFRTQRAHKESSVALLKEVHWSTWFTERMKRMKCLEASICGNSHLMPVYSSFIQFIPAFMPVHYLIFVFGGADIPVPSRLCHTQAQCLCGRQSSSQSAAQRTQPPSQQPMPVSDAHSELSLFPQNTELLPALKAHKQACDWDADLLISRAGVGQMAVKVTGHW